jgi:hypothetical protein
MGRRRSSLLSEGTTTGIAEATAERVMLSGEILKGMVEAMAKRDKIELRFREAVIHKLTRMEAVLAQVHVSHLVQDQRVDHIGYYPHKLTEDAEAAEEWIAQRSLESGIAAMKYIYGEQEEGDAKPKKAAEVD